jgi:hypothetical protein
VRDGSFGIAGLKRKQIRTRPNAEVFARIGGFEQVAKVFGIVAAERARHCARLHDLGSASRLEASSECPTERMRFVRIPVF